MHIYIYITCIYKCIYIFIYTYIYIYVYTCTYPSPQYDSISDLRVSPFQSWADSVNPQILAAWQPRMPSCNVLKTNMYCRCKMDISCRWGHCLQHSVCALCNACCFHGNFPRFMHNSGNLITLTYVLPTGLQNLDFNVVNF